MTPTRDRLHLGSQIDTGVGSPVAQRPSTWEYEGAPVALGVDTGIGSPVASRHDTLDSGDAFIPALWR